MEEEVETIGEDLGIEESENNSEEVKQVKKKKNVKKSSKKSKKVGSDVKEKPVNVGKTMKIELERDIAMDFAVKVYQKFDKVVKSIVLFGSSAKKVSTPDSDIDVIVIIDDVAIKWDEELIAWYREELGKIVYNNPYQKEIHANTVKLSTWWEDLSKGDPVVINVIRYGDPLIDFGGFFVPLKVLLQEGKIKPTPESIYTLLQRAPHHIARARRNMLEAVDGLYWSVVDSAHAALIAAKIMPPSPEHIPEILENEFVSRKALEPRFVDYYKQLYNLSKEIIHGKRGKVEGKLLDDLDKRANEFVTKMAQLIDQMIS